MEPLCRNCKKPGHIASECCDEPVCNSCGKPGHLAKGCAVAKQQEGGVLGGGGGGAGGLPKAWLCNNCYRPGHLAVECWNEKACNNCRQPGHLARDCLNSPVCNGCSQRGHIARDCPRLLNVHKIAPLPLSPRRSGAAPSFGDMICHNCHQPGHRSKECLQVSVNQCPGSFWAESVKILVILNPTSYMLAASGFAFFIWGIFYRFLYNDRWISWSLELQTVISRTQPSSATHRRFFPDIECDKDTSRLPTT